MTVRFVSVAEQEFAEAFSYYNKEKPGLGFEFVAEVDAAIERIVAFPEAWPRLSERSRRTRLRRFPFGLLYQIRGDEILVVGVMDMRRDPESWRNRL